MHGTLSVSSSDPAECLGCLKVVDDIYFTYDNLVGTSTCTGRIEITTQTHLNIIRRIFPKYCMVD